MADRYFVETPIAGSTAMVSGHEAHHLAHVMRAKPGTMVTLFDGTGAEFIARVERVGRSEIELAVCEGREIDREAAVRITLGVALPKGDRARWLVEKATELGAWRIVPLLTERGNQRETPSALEKLRRAVIEASKQCGRNRLVEIAQPAPLEKYLAAEPAESTRLIAHPGAPSSVAGNRLEPSSQLGYSLAVGPEGGFTDAELDRAVECGWRRIDLGPRILRVETAALALVALIEDGARNR
jgi:16S rRNA (uracil1498-N3)-methyltransferase